MITGIIKKENVYSRLLPITIDDINENEAFLENVIINDISILNIENRDTGIYGPYKIFTQIVIDSPQGRKNRTDIVIFSASGHVIIVEVKLYKNPELRDRRVISQIVDYASCFTNIKENDLIKIFGSNHETWEECIQEYFPDEEEAGDLARKIYERLLSGEVTLIIACDKAPIGLTETIEGIVKQSAFAFKLQLIEIVPYRNDSNKDIVFFPNVRLETEIVSRSVVKVIYSEGEPKPGVEIIIDGLDKIDDNINNVNQGIRKSKTPVNDSISILRNKMNELVKSGIINPPWCWQGFDVVFDLYNDKVKKFKIDVCFERYYQPEVDHDDIDEMKIRFTPMGRKDKEQRFLLLKEYTKNPDLIKLLGNDIECHDITIDFYFKRQELLNEVVEADTIADIVVYYMTNIIKIFSAQVKP